MLDTAYINAVLSLAKVCDLFSCWAGPAQCCYVCFLVVVLCLNIDKFPLEKKKKPVSAWPCPRGKLQKRKRKFCNYILWYTKKLRSPSWGSCGRAGLRAGKLWELSFPASSPECLSVCLSHVQSTVCKEKMCARCGIDISLSCLCFVLDCLNFWKLLSHYHFSTPFFPGVFVPAIWTRWESSFFICFIFMCWACLSLLIRSFWHVRCLLRPHTSFFRSFLFPQPAYFTWQGQFPAVSWLDTPTLFLFMSITPLHTHTQNLPH